MRELLESISTGSFSEMPSLCIFTSLSEASDSKILIHSPPLSITLSPTVLNFPQANRKMAGRISFGDFTQCTPICIDIYFYDLFGLTRNSTPPTTTLYCIASPSPHNRHHLLNQWKTLHILPDAGWHKRIWFCRRKSYQRALFALKRFIFTFDRFKLF